MDFRDIRPLSKVAKQILQKRYFLEKETVWEELVERNINYIVPSNHPDKDFFRQIILNRYFLPNSPSLANAGKPGAGLCACFTVKFEDTIEEIYKTKLEFALIARKGGGCGTTLSNLRPKGNPVGGSSHGYAGGPVAFADTISHDMSVITQGGLRPMAIMFTMSVYHPDILEFINAKFQEGKIENANISVVVDNEFMRKVETGETYWTIFGEKKYQELSARDVFNLIVEGAWRNGEPGFLFQDRIDDSPYQYTGQKIQATNPCSEQPLPPNGVCNLGSIDLSKLVKKDGTFDYEMFETIIRLGVRYLDLTADASSYPTPEIEKWMLENRPVGLSLMGWADCLLMRKIAYGSQEAVDEIAKVGGFYKEIAYDESEKLGKAYGIPLQCQKLPIPRRNITVTTLAPTGTVSLIAGCSSGIEPIFSEITIRNDKTGTYRFEHELISQPYFRCAVPQNGAVAVTWQEHVEALAAWQAQIDSGVSKTINFPEHAHKETMGKAVMMAWEKGCKGIAMYRDSSRKVQVLTPKNLEKGKCPQCGEEINESGNVKKCSKCEWTLKEVV